MEDKFGWKITLDEKNLELKANLDGRQPLMEDNLVWKMTLDERQP